MSYETKQQQISKEMHDLSLRLENFTKSKEYSKGYSDCKKEYEEKLRWIPVEERLPDNNILVEVRNDSCTPKYSHSFLKKRMWVNPYSNVYTSPVPTHWRHIL